MKLICSKGHSVKWNDKKCAECGEDQSIFAYVKRKAKRAAKGPLVYCTGCSRPFPIGYKECPFCERENSVENAVNTVALPLRDTVEKASPRTRRNFQRFYLILSACALVAAFRHMTSLENGEWMRIGALSVIYLAFVALLAKWFVRTDIILKFLLLTSWVVKLALMFNYLTCLVLLQMAVAEWWAQFVALGAIVAITYGGAWAFCSLFWPTAENIKTIFLGQSNSSLFDSMKDQGRRGRHDDGRGGGAR